MRTHVLFGLLLFCCVAPMRVWPPTARTATPISLEGLPFPVDHQLEETALLLGIDSERLLRIRLAMRGGTRSSDFITPRAAWGPSRVMRWWIRFEVANAAEVLKRMLVYLAERARAARDDREYRYATNFGAQVMDQLAELNPSLSFQTQNWSAPHSGLGARSHEIFDRMEGSLTSLRVRRVSDPFDAAARLDSPNRNFTYSSRMEIAAKLHGTGAAEDAIRLAEDAVLHFSRSGTRLPDDQRHVELDPDDN